MDIDDICFHHVKCGRSYNLCIYVFMFMCIVCACMRACLCVFSKSIIRFSYCYYRESIIIYMLTQIIYIVAANHTQKSLRTVY